MRIIKGVFQGSLEVLVNCTGLIVAPLGIYDSTKSTSALKRCQSSGSALRSTKNTRSIYFGQKPCQSAQSRSSGAGSQTRKQHSIHMTFKIKHPGRPEIGCHITNRLLTVHPCLLWHDPIRWMNTWTGQKKRYTLCLFRIVHLPPQYSLRQKLLFQHCTFYQSWCALYFKKCSEIHFDFGSNTDRCAECALRVCSILGRLDVCRQVSRIFCFTLKPCEH